MTNPTGSLNLKIEVFIHFLFGIKKASFNKSIRLYCNRKLEILFEEILQKKKI